MVVKVNARILTDVEYVIDEDIENGREVTRKLLEHLAVDGYKNNEITYIKTHRIEPEEIDLDVDLSDFAQEFMYSGKP